jgi:serine phosphatase RsbU (regulator of sigma subunit)
VVIKNRDLAPKDIVAKIKSDLSAFVGEVRQHDDQTVLVLKMKI